ncbi:GIY-YIG nuclease family protein [Nocardioides sp. TRM66260-LWL]|uniref:GIY-YIG nuclease family protein n=1 Tax=Nocardioides sp. TRM66260-LWL TaxID=2874478 RepID=UPI001CC45127|nr:GIY-YIG nuclease family protein [Nocardioides sp. TRM66260-LWL]MBZ5734958.1 GIY-YIG nuclease family protein [Nocardioides sp. TRM66260-LWL]
MPWVYILRCADDSFYVGSTVDLPRRLAEHQRGDGAAYTRIRRRRPVTLAWSAEFDSIEVAFRYEKQIQGWSRAKRLALMEGRLEDLPELSRSRSDPRLA